MKEWKWTQIPRSVYDLHVACVADLKLFGRCDEVGYQSELYDVGDNTYVMKVSQESYDEVTSYGWEDRYYITILNK